MKFKIKQKDSPAISPGVWEDSILRLYFKGPKYKADQIHTSIMNSISKNSDIQISKEEK